TPPTRGRAPGGSRLRTRRGRRAHPRRAAARRAPPWPATRDANAAPSERRGLERVQAPRSRLVAPEREHVLAVQVRETLHAGHVELLARRADRLCGLGERFLAVDVATLDLRHRVAAVRHEEVLVATLRVRHHVE